MTQAQHVVTWDPKTPCPDCGQDQVFGYQFRNELDQHMHSHYVCTFWGKGKPSACGWHGWSVPDTAGTLLMTRTGRVQVACINWSRPDAPRAVVWIEDAPFDLGGMSSYFDTFAEAITYADKLAHRPAEMNNK